MIIKASCLFVQIQQSLIFYTNSWNPSQKLQSTTSCVLYPLLLHLLPVLTSRSNSRTTFLLLRRHAPAVSLPHTCPSSSSLEAPHSVKSSVLIQQFWSKSSLHVLMLSMLKLSDLKCTVCGAVEFCYI